MPPERVSVRDVRRIAAEAELDDRTVHRVLVDGHPPRARGTRKLIVEAIAKLGLAIDVPECGEER